VVLATNQFAQKVGQIFLSGKTRKLSGGVQTNVYQPTDVVFSEQIEESLGRFLVNPMVEVPTVGAARLE